MKPPIESTDGDVQHWRLVFLREARVFTLNEIGTYSRWALATLVAVNVAGLALNNTSERVFSFLDAFAMASFAIGIFFAILIGLIVFLNLAKFVDLMNREIDLGPNRLSDALEDDLPLRQIRKIEAHMIRMAKTCVVLGLLSLGSFMIGVAFTIFAATHTFAAA